MTDFLIEPLGNGDHDLTVTDNDFVVVGGTEDTWPDELRQRVLYSLGTWYAESAWDRSAGFPWIEGVFGRQPIDGIASLVYQKIIDTEGVDGVVDQPVITLDTSTRVLSISAKVLGRGFTVPIETSIIEGGQQ